VVSTARLSEDAALLGRTILGERLAKESVHELGHVLGLLHCGTPGCVMGRSAGVRDVDAKGHALCEACRGLLAEPPGRRRHVQ
jgi:archaemetzincin